MSIQQLPLIHQGVQTFLLSRQAAGHSDRTVQFYEQQLRYFLDTLPPNSTIDKLTADTIEEYLARRQREVKPRSVHCAFRAIKTFCRWLEKRYDGWSNPIPHITAPRVPSQHPKPVDREVVKALLDTCEGRGFFAERDKAAILFLATSGLRAQEFLSLKQEHVDLKTGAVHIKNGKGNKARMTIISPQARLAVANYLSHLRNREPNDPLWWGKQGPMTYSGLVGLLKNRARQANVTAPSPHDFRRRWATDMVPKLGPWVVQSLGGWASMQIVQSYVTLSETDLLKAYEENVLKK